MRSKHGKAKKTSLGESADNWAQGWEIKTQRWVSVCIFCRFLQFLVSSIQNHSRASWATSNCPNIYYGVHMTSRQYPLSIPIKIYGFNTKNVNLLFKRARGISKFVSRILLVIRSNHIYHVVYFMTVYECQFCPLIQIQSFGTNSAKILLFPT